MIIMIFFVVMLSILIAFVLNAIDDFAKYSKITDMSFREAMDLVELPIVTFYNGNKKLNFLLDTGSNICQINSSVLPLVDHKKIEEKNTNVIGIEGNKVNTEFCEITLTYRNQKFTSDFSINNLDDAFAIVKEESGVQLHGILGSLFFQKYDYILDFESLVAYSKRK